MNAIFISFFVISSFLNDKQVSNFFPLDYSYAIHYHYNIGELKTRPEKFIYSDESGFAKSCSPLGDTLSTDQIKSISSLFSKGTYGLIGGLSKTFFPQNGIVFYNSKNEPFASISIGFECGQVVFWKKGKGIIRQKEKYNEKKAEEILKNLKVIIIN